MGGNVVGAGTNTITIHGVEKLTGVEHAVYLIVLKQVHLLSATITRGDVFVKGAVKNI